MALSGLDIYKLLPKTNCRECGFATCLAFAMQLAKRAVLIDKCPYVEEEAKKVLESAGQPPIKLVKLGSNEHKLEIGNETVLFRHEEKFHNPCGIGFIIEDDLSDAEIKKALKKINELTFERIGQKLEVNLVAVKQNKTKKRFLEVLKIVLQQTPLVPVLMSADIEALCEALELVKQRTCLVYNATLDNFSSLADIVKDHNAALVVSAQDLGELSDLTQELNKRGVENLVLDSGKKPIREKIWDLTQIRRLPLKKGQRALGYPSLVILDEGDDLYEEAMEAAIYILKYAGIVLLKRIDRAQIFSLLALRQNIYSDPQKPLQIEPKAYPVGPVNDSSPVLITTNFSLTYYTVLGEVEASRVPSYIVSVDTEGMSVLTAWAAEKFTPEKITEALNKYEVKGLVSHKRIIIPGYVAVISGDLQDESGWDVLVGPKEASGIPALLKNL